MLAAVGEATGSLAAVAAARMAAMMTAGRTSWLLVSKQTYVFSQQQLTFTFCDFSPLFVVAKICLRLKAIPAISGWKTGSAKLSK